MSRNSNHSDAIPSVPCFTREKEYALFDSLPYKLRNALANANEDYAISQVYFVWINGKYTEEQITQAIRGE